MRNTLLELLIAILFALAIGMAVAPDWTEDTIAAVYKGASTIFYEIMRRLG